MRKIKVLIVDDHKLLAQGMMHMLSEEADFEVVGWASSGEEAINAVKKSTPDVIIMDILLKKMTGIEASKWIKEHYPQTNIILLSMQIRKEFLSAGIQCGISGYLHKDIGRTTLFEAIRSVHRGRQFFTDSVMKLVFDDYLEDEKRRKAPPEKRPDSLTAREYEILQLIAGGKSNGEIAEALSISTKTVDTHKSHIFDKLGLKSTAELTVYAIKNNIITL